MRHPAGSILSFLALLVLTACADRPPPAGPRQPVALSMGRMLVDLPVGQRAGAYGWGLECRPPFNEVAWITEGRVPGMLTQAARDGIGWGGLGLTEGAGRVLTGRLVDVDLSLCRKVDPWTDKPIGDTGEGRVRIDWEVTDPPGPVQRFTTQGEGETTIPALNGRYDIILRNAAADAARKLASLPAFRTLVTTPPDRTAAIITPSPQALGPVPSTGSAPIARNGTVPPPAPPPVLEDQIPADPAANDAEASLLRWDTVTGVVADAQGLVLLPDRGGDPPRALPLLLADGRVVEAVPMARAFGLLLARLPPGDWPALTLRRQRPSVSHWLYRLDDKDAPAAMVAAHTGPARSQGTEIQGLLLDLDKALWRDPPWLLVDEEGRLAALRGPPVLPGDPAPYYAPAGVMAHFRAITTQAAPAP